jgi:hypothetical protein
MNPEVRSREVMTYQNNLIGHRLSDANSKIRGAFRKPRPLTPEPFETKLKWIVVKCLNLLWRLHFVRQISLGGDNSRKARLPAAHFRFSFFVFASPRKHARNHPSSDLFAPTDDHTTAKRPFLFCHNFGRRRQKKISFHQHHQWNPFL